MAWANAAASNFVVRPDAVAGRDGSWLSGDSLDVGAFKEYRSRAKGRRDNGVST